MFSPPTAPPRSPRPSLRERLVRGLDVAVELVTLGEYGVEAVAVDQAPCSGHGADADAWSWPAPQPSPRRCAGDLCPDSPRPSRGLARARAGATPPRRSACPPGFRRTLSD